MLSPIEQWRLNLRNRYATPYARGQISSPTYQPSLWSRLTPWKEELGETFGQVWHKPFTAFGAAVTSPFTPGVPGTEHLPWLQREEAEYEAWEEPTWTTPWGWKIRPTKGIVESLPLFAGAGVLGVAGKLGMMAAKGGMLGRAAGLGVKALTPATKLARAERAVTGAALKGVGAVVKPVVKPIGQAIQKALPMRPSIVAGKLTLPSSQMLDARFAQDFPRSFAQWAERVPILNKIVRTLGGNSAFVRSLSGEPKDIVLKELVKRDVLLGMRTSAQGFYMPALQKYGSPIKLLKISPKGVVGAVKQKGYLYDVLENPKAYTWLDNTAKQYVNDLRGIVDDVYKLAQKEGIKTPDDIIIHRIVKGKTTPRGYEISELGSFFERERVYKTMREGVEKGMEYGLNPNESVFSTISHYVKRIADERLKKAVRPFRVKGPATLEAGTAEIAIRHPAFMRKAYAGKVRVAPKVAGEEVVERVRTVMRPGVFPKEVTQVAERYLKDEGQTWLKAMSGVSGVGRLLVAALDFSAPFIQGLPILGRRPDIWAKATLRHYGFFRKPQNLYKYMSNPETMALRAERILYGSSSAPFEFFEALEPLQRVVGKVPAVGKVSKKLIEQTYGRAEAAFTGFGEMSRNEMWKALRRPNMGEKQLTELATILDRMTGTMSTEALGIGLSQRQFESAFMFFAPRYTRAGLSLVSDVFKGGLTGAEARKALGGMMAGGATMYVGVCKALGQEPNFDPSSAEFMTIGVGEDRIGIGGMMTALARFGADVIATTQENPMDLFMPFKNKRLNRWDNPFVRFLYSRTAPLTGLTVGAAVENADYFGRPMEDLSDWGRFLMDKVTPIAAQRVAPWSEERATLPGLAGEVVGMRTWGARKITTPEQMRRVAYEEIENNIWAQYPSDYPNIAMESRKLDKYESKRLLRQYPGLVMAMKRIEREKQRWLLRNRRLFQSSGIV